MKKTNLKMFKELTNSHDESDNAILALVRFGKGRIKSTLLVYPKFYSMYVVSVSRNLVYHRWAWFELIVPNKDVTSNDPLYSLHYPD